MGKGIEREGKEPEYIFVVVCGSTHRVYVREGQALNWLKKKVAEGQPAKMFRYAKEEQVAG